MAKNKWRIKEAVKIAEEAALKALRTGAESILTESIDETPIETGTLRRSGTVTVGGLPDGAQVGFHCAMAALVARASRLARNRPRTDKADFIRCLLEVNSLKSEL